MSEIRQDYLRDIRYKLIEQGWRFDYLNGWVNAKHPGISIRINEASITVFVEHEFVDVGEVNKFLKTTA